MARNPESKTRASRLYNRVGDKGLLTRAAGGCYSVRFEPDEVLSIRFEFKLLGRGDPRKTAEFLSLVKPVLSKGNQKTSW